MENILKFLEKNSTMIIATAQDNTPRASAMEYYFIDGAIVFGTAIDSIKDKNLKANSKISASIHDMPQFITVDGTAVPASAAEIAEYTKRLYAKRPEFKEMAESGKMRPFAFYKIVPKAYYFNDYSSGMSPTTVVNA